MPLTDVAKNPFSEIGRKLQLLLSTGQLLMESGADTSRLVRDVKRVAAYMGIPEDKLHMHVLCTTLMINVNDGDHTYTSFRKCPHHGVNMTVISSISHLSWEAFEKNYSLDEYETELNKIKSTKRNYSQTLTMLGAGLACGAFCKLFGCDWIAFFLTAISTSFGFWIRSICNGKWKMNTYVGIAIASFAATCLAYLTHFIPGSSTPWYPMIACTLFIVPGIPLINAVDDMVNGFIVAGSTRAINTLLIVSGMTFGIIMAIRLCSVDDFTTLSLIPDDVIHLDHAIAAAIAAVGFSVIFNVPPRLLPLAAVGGMIAVCLRNFFYLNMDMTQVISSFIGATAVGIITLRVSHWIHVPVHVLTIPSVIPMIPGVLLYRLLFAIININHLDVNEMLVAIQGGVSAIMIIVGIAVGVTIPSLVAGKYIENFNKNRLEKILANQK